MSDFFYPILHEDSGRIKLEVSANLASPWLGSKYEMLRWIRSKLTPDRYDTTFVLDARQQVASSKAPEVTPVFEAEARAETSKYN